MIFEIINAVILVVILFFLMRMVAETQRVSRTIFYLADKITKIAEEKVVVQNRDRPDLKIVLPSASVGGFSDAELKDEEDLDGLREQLKQMEDEQKDNNHP